MTRIDRVFKAMEKQGLSQMLVTDPVSVFYMTGIQVEPGERFFALLLKENGEHVLFLNHLFNVPEEAPFGKVWYSDTDPVMEYVKEQIDDSRVLGVDKDLKARFLLPLMEGKTTENFVNASLAVDLTRGIKDADEQAKMRAASAINDQAMERLYGLVRKGTTEREIADRLLEIYLELGAEGFSFPPIVSFGANAADPHHMPDDTVLTPGDVVLFDVGCVKDGYCSDMTRTVYYKKATEQNREIYELVRRANEAAIAKIKPGVPLCELDRTARNIIAEAGYGENFNHRLGHFIGLSEHEFGDVSLANEQTAEPGMIFSIEPGIYLAGETGVRIEDLVLVTPDGVEVLNHYTKELTIIAGK
ncbi:MAG TPA: peptidase M24 family protein [Lachnospiraceae bacterium]|nr:peptidase M24 family protein [Lachnospiraceae bacterium]